MYGGGIPSYIGNELGVRIGAAVGGTDGRKYYLCADGVLYAFDTYMNLWHIEDELNATAMSYGQELLCGADGTHRSATLSLPFVFPLETEGDYVEAECAVCGLNVRRKKNGETEAEATLRLSLRTFEERSWGYICETEEGENYGEADGGFSVFLTSAGEDLWQVSKRLACAPEDLQKSNPSLTFPLKDGERIYVYRQLKD